MKSKFEHALNHNELMPFLMVKMITFHLEKKVGVIIYI